MKYVKIGLGETLLKKIDDYIEMADFPSRAEFIRMCIRSFFSRLESNIPSLSKTLK